jgi:hypothetical protein
MIFHALVLADLPRVAGPATALRPFLGSGPSPPVGLRPPSGLGPLPRKAGATQSKLQTNSQLEFIRNTTITKTTPHRESGILIVVKGKN